MPSSIRSRALALASLTTLMTTACAGAPPGPGPAELASVAIPVAPNPRPPKRKAAPPPKKEAPMTAAPATFADDLAFLQEHSPMVVLEGEGGARVAVSPKYQGRVMTSGVDAGAQSFGWINRAFIASNTTGTQFDNYGGEDRFWLGPEAGPFGLYFAPGKPFTFDEWKVPAALQEGAWDVRDMSKTKITLKRAVQLVNWSGTKLAVDVERTVAIVSPDEAKRALHFDALGQKDVKVVAFESTNKITNAGKEPLKKATGLVSVWILGMFAPAADAHVVIPFVTGPALKGPIVTDAYFGKVPADRLAVHEDKGALYFKVDGKHRSKIGVGPARVKNVLGSYSAASKLLTIVQIDLPADHAKLPYVNSLWEKQKDPYAGDVVNSYNDGPVAEGKPSLGGFYELETSSPGAELAPGKSLVHTQRIFHFVGEPAALEPIAKAVLGVSLADVAAAN